MLIGTGWSYMKPLLNNREKQILMIVIPLQVGCLPPSMPRRALVLAQPSPFMCMPCKMPHVMPCRMP